MRNTLKNILEEEVKTYNIIVRGIKVQENSKTGKSCTKIFKTKIYEKRTTTSRSKIA
jgi:hypothetical protein